MNDQIMTTWDGGDREPEDELNATIGSLSRALAGVTPHASPLGRGFSIFEPPITRRLDQVVSLAYSIGM
jgi:hypothetical protein